MHTLIVLGSPRKNGNSEILARTVAEGIEESGGTTEYIRLNELSIRGCQGCGGCDKTGMCVVKDDMIALYERVDNADRVLLVSPVYFYAVSAQLKLFIDRMQARWSRKYNLKQRFREGEGRRGHLLATSATKGKRVFECCELSVRYAFDAMDLEMGESLLVKGVDDKGEILESEQAIKDAREFGRRMETGQI